MQNVINDMLFTPYKSIYPVLKYIPKEGIVWECTDCGKSKIAEVLKSKGYKVYSSDILEGFNFLEDKPNFEFDMILTNPPYSLKTNFIKKCYEYNKPWGLLLPLSALEGKRRGEMFKEKGVSLVVFDERADFTGKGSNWFNSSWFLWNMPIGNNKLIFEKLAGE